MKTTDKQIDKYNIVQQHADGLYKAGLDVICITFILLVVFVGVATILYILGVRI